MNTSPAISRAALSLVILGLVTGVAAAEDLPVVKGKQVVARVQGEIITLDDLRSRLAAANDVQSPGAAMDRQAELALLTRMIHMTLIAQEARRMGLDKQPELVKLLAVFSQQALREELVTRAFTGVQADPKVVEAGYREAVRQWKVSVAAFETEEHAKAMAAEVTAGKPFLDVAKAYLAAGKAKKVEEGTLVKPKAVEAPIASVLASMAVGATSPVISTSSGFLLVTLEDVRYPDNPEARAAAERTALAAARKAKVAALDAALRAKYAKVDTELLKRLDFEAQTPGIDALLKDRRALVAIKGDRPITVGEMTESLKFRFFHGVSLAIERKRLNDKKDMIVDAMVQHRVFRKEALRLGLDKSDSYRRKVKDYEQSLLFSVFLKKVLAPGIKVTDEQVKRYYDEHRRDYTSPAMVRIRSLAFADRASAERSLEALKKGADFQWVAGQAEAHLDANTPGLLTFDGRPIMTSELPEGAQKAVAGAGAGDAVLWVSPEQHVYVLAVDGVIPAQVQAYEEVIKDVAERVVNAEVQKAFEEYAEKLRSLSDVKIYLKAS